jgi:hypothetical protein
MGIILQAPVSDRHLMESEHCKFNEYLELAGERISKGQGGELMPRDADFAPVTAHRFFSLASKG